MFTILSLVNAYQLTCSKLLQHYRDLLQLYGPGWIVEIPHLEALAPQDRWSGVVLPEVVNERQDSYVKALAGEIDAIPPLAVGDPRS